MLKAVAAEECVDLDSKYQSHKDLRRALLDQNGQLGKEFLAEIVDKLVLTEEVAKLLTTAIDKYEIRGEEDLESSSDGVDMVPQVQLLPRTSQFLFNNSDRKSVTHRKSEITRQKSCLFDSTTKPNMIHLINL